MVEDKGVGSGICEPCSWRCVAGCWMRWGIFFLGMKKMGSGGIERGKDEG